MEEVIRGGLAIAIAVAHAPFVLRFWKSIRRREIPEILSFAALGVVVYYDIGFVLEAFGWHYPSPFFGPLASFRIEAFVSIGLVILVAPYLLALGCRATAAKQVRVPLTPVLEFAPRMKAIFLAVFVPTAATLAAVGYYAIHGAVSAAETKLIWLGTLGSGYIAFLLPAFLVAFFIRTRDAGARYGLAVVAFLLLTSVASTLFLGQRTMTLLPFLMVMLFHFRRSVLRLALVTVALLVAASAALFFYKGHAIDKDLDLLSRAEMVIGNDLTRAQVLGRAVQESLPLGTVVMPYTGQGYIYAALFYLPRSVAPYKGHSTPAYFTAMTNGESAEFIAWGLGLGFLEEIILNLGFWVVVPGTIVYGMGLGLLQRLSAEFPSTVTGTHLGAFWMCGYALPSVLLYFGSMTILSILLECFFVARPSRLRASHGHFLRPGQIPPSSLSAFNGFVAEESVR